MTDNRRDADRDSRSRDYHASRGFGPVAMEKLS